MEDKQSQLKKMTNFRWVICAMLFFATTVNYLDRQVLSLTWKDFIAPEFHWTDADYGKITAIFSLVYAIANLFAGRFIDRLGTKKGYLWAIGIWSVGACLHAACGWATEKVVGADTALGLIGATGQAASYIALVSVYFFIAARIVLAAGEAGNFPAAIKVTAEYFPKKDRAYATSIFNAGSIVGALVAPLTIPSLARYFKNLGVGNGWEMAFIVIGALGFVWMAFWVFVYKDVHANKRVNALELKYIEQDKELEAAEAAAEAEAAKNEKKLSFWQILRYPQTWEFAVGKFMTDGVWWFLLFWTPAYIKDVYGFSSDTTTAKLLIFVLYAISLLSIYGGKLPTIIINKSGKDPYSSRMKAMLLFALVPLLALLAQPLGRYSYWWPIIIIGLVCAAHQSWSANIYTVVSDMFPKSAVGSVVGLGQMTGAIGSALINYGSGYLFDYAEATNLHYFGFVGKPAGYFIIFCICAVAYLIGWIIMKLLVPRYKPIMI